MRNTIGMGLALFALGCIVGHLTGCARHDQLTVENAAAVAQYDEALVACKAKARAAKDVAVFDACEAEVTRSFCASSEALRNEWPRCKEVLP